MENSCIVLEGGGLRGAFTAGILEFLLEQDIEFDRVVGVSAGACVGASYISKQKGRNQKVNVDLPSDKRYMGFSHLIKTGSYFNMEFVFNEIPNRLVPFDEQAFYENSAEFDVVTTSLNTGESVVFTRNDYKKFSLNKVLVASSSIPLLAQPVKIEEKFYFDGGVSDSIPVKYALDKHDKVVVVLTRPRGYRKEKMSNKLIYQIAFRKYPKFLKTLINRNLSYNETLDYCDQMEKEGKLYIIAPSAEFVISRTEKDFGKRMSFFNHGKEMMQREIQQVIKFLSTP